MFQALRDREGSRCPVIACDWRHAQPLHAPGVLTLLDSHMVDAHPTTEWAKRVMARRIAEGIDTTA